MMRALVTLDAQRAVMQTDFAKHAAVEEGPQILVNGGQRDGWNPGSHFRVNGLRAGMSGQGQYRLINHLPLMRRGKPVTVAQFAKISGLEHFVTDSNYYPIRIGSPANGGRFKILMDKKTGPCRPVAGGAPSRPGSAVPAYRMAAWRRFSPCA